MRHRTKARFDGIAVQKRTENPGAKQARSHARDAGIEGREQRGRPSARGFFRENWIDQFEIADGYGIEDERVVLLVIANAVEMAKRFDRGRRVAIRSITRIAAVRRVFAEIVNDSSRRGDGLRVCVEAEASELCYAELFAKDAVGVIVLKNPIFKARFDSAGAIEQGSFRGFEKLLRAGQ